MYKVLADHTDMLCAVLKILYVICIRVYYKFIYQELIIFTV